MLVEIWKVHFREVVFRLIIFQADLSIWCTSIIFFFLSLYMLDFDILKGQFYRVHVGVQSPEGITTTRCVLRRFNDFLKLYSVVSLYIFISFWYLYHLGNWIRLWQLSYSWSFLWRKAYWFLILIITDLTMFISCYWLFFAA